MATLFESFTAHQTDGTAPIVFKTSGGTTLKIALASTAPSAADDEYFADFTELSGTGYTSGGKTVTPATVSESGGDLTVTFNSVTWDQNGSGFTNATHAILYADDGGSDPLIAFHAFGSSVSIQQTNMVYTFGDLVFTVSTGTYYDSFTTNQHADGTNDIDFDSDTLNIGFLDNTHTPSASTHTDWSDVSGDEIATGAWYSAGGVALTSVSKVESGGVATYNCDDITLSTNASGPDDIRYAVLYKPSTGKLVRYWDLVADKSIKAQDFTFSPSSGFHKESAA